jgi:hypothetical protein
MIYAAQTIDGPGRWRILANRAGLLSAKIRASFDGTERVSPTPHYLLLRVNVAKRCVWSRFNGTDSNHPINMKTAKESRPHSCRSRCATALTR